MAVMARKFADYQAETAKPLAAVKTKIVQQKKTKDVDVNKAVTEVKRAAPKHTKKRALESLKKKVKVRKLRHDQNAKDTDQLQRDKLETALALVVYLLEEAIRYSDNKLAIKMQENIAKCAVHMSKEGAVNFTSNEFLDEMCKRHLGMELADTLFGDEDALIKGLAKFGVPKDIVKTAADCMYRHNQANANVTASIGVIQNGEIEVSATTIEDAEDLQRALDSTAESLTASINAEGSGNVKLAAAHAIKASKVANHLAAMVANHRNRTTILLEEKEGVQ